MIKAQLPEAEFMNWESKFADREQLVLNVVSIVIFLKIFLQLYTEHY